MKTFKRKMKTFKIFSIAFLCFVILFSGIVWSFNRFMKDNHSGTEVAKAVEWEEEEKEELDPLEKDLLKRLVRSSPRINMVLLGLDETRSDTMMFVSFNPENKRLDVISIPRDTYYHREGYNRLDKRKINSVYGDHGAKGVKTVVSDLLLDVPVDHYITVTYSGVASIIDSLGGVPVHIPRLMKYEDYADDPPLIIRFEPGNHVLNGEDGVKFLRYRKGTNGSGAMSYVDGDLGRIKAQQNFMKAAINKALSFRLPTVATTAFRHVRTDMELQEVVRYATAAVGLKLEEVDMNMLPGEDKYRNGVSYYIHDIQVTRDLLIKIYSEGEEVEEVERFDDEVKEINN